MPVSIRATPRMPSADSTIRGAARSVDLIDFARRTSGFRRMSPSGSSRRDANRDGQVAMAEYTIKWTDSMAANFEQFDRNGDGLVSPEEALAAAAEGIAYAGEVPTAATDTSSGGSPPSATRESPSAPKVDERYLAYAQEVIAKYDADADGVLVAGEWQNMRVDAKAADANGDGKISAVEYAAWLVSQ